MHNSNTTELFHQRRRGAVCLQPRPLTITFPHHTHICLQPRPQLKVNMDLGGTADLVRRAHNFMSWRVRRVMSGLVGCLPVEVEETLDKVGRMCGISFVDRINRLPESILVSEIFGRLQVGDVGRARCVCRRWDSILSSWELFGDSWCNNNNTRICTDIEQWMRSADGGDTHDDDDDAHTVKWIAGSRCLLRQAPPEFKLSKLYVLLASSHGLVCWTVTGETMSSSQRVVVGNPRTRKWKLLPLPDTPDFRTGYNLFSPEYSVRFINHHPQQKQPNASLLSASSSSYTLFFLVFYRKQKREFAFLYNSQQASWKRISRRPMLRHRFSTGLQDASVIVIDYRYVDLVNEVMIVAYDSCNDTWDELSVTLFMTTNTSTTSNSGDTTAATSTTSSSGDTTAAARDINSITNIPSHRFGCFINHVSLHSNAKDEYCKQLVVDVSTGIISLWQLDKHCTGFELVSSTQLRPKWAVERPFSSKDTLYDDRASATHVPSTIVCVIRSDEKVFMAILVYAIRFWLIIYDLGRSLWLMALADGENNLLFCESHSAYGPCKWPLLEYDVQWHDHVVHIDKCHKYLADVMPLKQHQYLQGPAAAITADGQRPTTADGQRCLHLVHAPNIWSAP